MKKLLIFLGILFILQNGIALAIVALGIWDPFKFGEESKEFSTQVVEEFFTDWDPEYLKSKYNEKARDSGVVDLAIERLIPLQEEYGRLIRVDDVKRTSYNFRGPNLIPWVPDIDILYSYQFFSEFEKGDVVIQLGVVKELDGWGIMLVGIKSPLDDLVFVTKKANQAVVSTQATSLLP
ncbi:hypothetical protein [Rubellicoccus peritrichatus]|uniref:Uncharacterized protein n=1 Tax=Rubellicoccus peritrichatus TaxID=3080537 RepID=A0AAQ3LDM5_9BACT|nr:hypothetical protein [Puniceicoccus sp. CR14]WOO40174.1 hypothetical protein RZN69_16250 [Puniceicoccus sp. CR14]